MNLSTVHSFGMSAHQVSDSRLIVLNTWLRQQKDNLLLNNDPTEELVSHFAAIGEENVRKILTEEGLAKFSFFGFFVSESESEIR